MAIAPAISVVIPCHNAAAYLGAAIRSALEQSEPPVEVVVVDDGSTDDSAAIAAAMGPTVRVVRQPNGGAAIARNTGTQHATGEWIAYLDADDVWERTRLSRLRAAIRTASAETVCIFNDLYFFHADGRREARATPIESLDGDFHVRLLTDWLVNPSCILVRADAARAVPFPAGVRHAEDPQHLVMLRARGPFVHVAEPLTGYRRRPGQLTRYPDHALIVIKHHLAFARSRPDLYSADDLLRLRSHFAEDLVDVHENAYWRRCHAVVRECRQLYAEVRPTPAPTPRLFVAPLYPAWLWRTKDWLDRLRGKRAIRERT